MATFGAQLSVVFEARRMAAGGCCRETVMGKSQTCTEGLGEGGKANCGANSGHLNVNFHNEQSILNDFSFQYSSPSTL